MSEETSPPAKKEKDLFGVPVSDLIGPALGFGVVGIVIGLANFFKPQIEGMQRDMAQRQAYQQQQQLLAAQAQQQQIAAQHQAHQDYNQGELEQQPTQSTPEQIQVDSPPIAVETDPFNRQNPRRVRIPEIEASGGGSDRFNNISI